MTGKIRWILVRECVAASARAHSEDLSWGAFRLRSILVRNRGVRGDFALGLR